MILDLDAIIFDWSGVISNDIRAVYLANIAILLYFGKKTFSFEEWRKISSSSSVRLFRSQEIGGKEASDDELSKLYKKWFDVINEMGIVPFMYEEVPEVLETLRGEGKRLIVLSSHPEENLRKEAEKYKIRQHFSEMFGNVHNKSEVLRQICEKIGVPRGRVLYIGDTVFDIQSAREAGVVSAGICTGYHTKERLQEEKPDYILDNLLDLIGKK